MLGCCIPGLVQAKGGGITVGKYYTPPQTACVITIKLLNKQNFTRLG